MEQLPGHRFYSSSLLLIYDGYAPTHESVDVRMIDFEHSTYPGFLNDPSHEGTDHGYLLGLTSLTRLFTEIRDGLHCDNNDGNE